jgi:hypothetical protein
MYLNPKARTLILLIALSILINGCDDGVARIAREAADRQAQQNTAMADLNKEVSAGTRRLVEADAQSRTEIVGVHRDLQAERLRLDTNWSALEQERRQIAGQRQTESLLAPSVRYAGLVALIVALLGFCWYAIVAARRSNDTDTTLNELLIAEMLPVQSTLLSDGTTSQSLLSHSQRISATEK